MQALPAIQTLLLLLLPLLLTGVVLPTEATKEGGSSANTTLQAQPAGKHHVQKVSHTELVVRGIVLEAAPIRVRVKSSCFTSTCLRTSSPPPETIPPFPAHWSMHSEWRRTSVSSTSKLWSDMDLQKWAVDTLWVRTTYCISKQTHTPSLSCYPPPSPLPMASGTSMRKGRGFL